MNLRSGFTTGACAAAAAKAIWCKYLGEDIKGSIALKFPDGEVRELKVSVDEERALVVKDAGDDPDITNGAHITATIEKVRGDVATDKDIKLFIGFSELIVRSGGGIGLVTKKGLDATVGKWAINPVPIDMIATNLKESKFGYYEGTFLLTISVKDGEKMAGKTLNSMLGVKGGISILGTSGIVVPNSHEAYVETIKIQLRGVYIDGGREIAFTTGNRTKRAIIKDNLEFGDETVIRIGDFIHDSLVLAGEFKFKRVVVGCMIGKLLKYSQGVKRTHAKDSRQEPHRLLEFIPKKDQKRPVVEIIENAATVSEAFEDLSGELKEKIVQKMMIASIKHFTSWVKRVAIEIRVYDKDESLLAVRRSR